MKESGEPALSSHVEVFVDSKTEIEKKLTEEEVEKELLNLTLDERRETALPPCVICFLRFAGATTPRKKFCWCLLSKIFWTLCIMLMIFTTIFLCEALYYHNVCIGDENCILQKGNKTHRTETNAIAEYGALSVVAFVLEIIGDIIGIILIHTWVPCIIQIESHRTDKNSKKNEKKKDKKRMVKW